MSHDTGTEKWNALTENMKNETSISKLKEYIKS